MRRVIETKYIKKVFETESSDYSEWFGYYNYDTLNSSQTKMLCGRALFDGVSPEKGMSIILGYYDLQSKAFTAIGESDSWNWQQGAMMQWLPSSDGDEKIIYNSSMGDHLISRIYNLRTRLTTDISWPIYGLTPDGKKSISLELERSRWCRAYHYKSVENNSMEGAVYEGDGVFEIDLETNKRRRIIAIQDVISTGYQPEFATSKHWLEHIMISPSGKKFCFLHRFSPVDNVFAYKTRLLIANIDGSNLKEVDGWQSMSWSHFGWQSDDSFAIYTREGGRYKNVLGFKNALLSHHPLSNLYKKTMIAMSTRVPYMLGRHLSGSHSYYRHYQLDTDNNARLDDNYESGLFSIDGHPSFTQGGKYMITDSYPDRQRMQRLIIFNTQSKKGKIVGRFYASYRGNPASCDLHPKLSRNGKYVVVDSAFDEKHHMIVYEIDWNQIRKDLK